MANPILNDKALKEASEAGYAAGSWGPPQGPPGYSTSIPGISDGPISDWTSQRMTVQGTATATGVFFVILLAAAALGWSLVETDGDQITKFPAWIIAGVLVGFGCVLAMRFKPQWAKVLGVGYA